MYYLLFTLYLLAFCFLVNRIPFIKNAGLDKRLVIVLFLFKAAAGVFIGWMSARYYPQGNDYWDMNQYGLEEYHLLTSDPKGFFTNIFHSPYADKYGGFFKATGSYWKDLATNIIIKAVALCDLFSRGNYYINSLFLNFFGFLGHVALYRIFSHVYSKRYQWAVIIASFLVPTTLYFTSGLHKDNIIFAMLGLFCYAFYFCIRQEFTKKRILLLAISAISLLLLRNYVLIALLPAAMAMYFADRNNKPFKTFASIYGALIAIVILLALLLPAASPLQIIVQRQKDFFELPVAVSQMRADTLKSSLESFAAITPAALEHGLFRPYVWEFPKSFLLFPAVELFICELLFIYVLIRRNVTISYKPFLYFGIFFSLTLLLFAGFIVPNAGSLVRYRSLYLPYLLLPILCGLFPRNKHIKILSIHSFCITITNILPTFHKKS